MVLDTEYLTESISLQEFALNVTVLASIKENKTKLVNFKRMEYVQKKHINISTINIAKKLQIQSHDSLVWALVLPRRCPGYLAAGKNDQSLG